MVGPDTSSSPHDMNTVISWLARCRSPSGTPIMSLKLCIGSRPPHSATNSTRPSSDAAALAIRLSTALVAFRVDLVGDPAHLPRCERGREKAAHLGVPGRVHRDDRRAGLLDLRRDVVAGDPVTGQEVLRAAGDLDEVAVGGDRPVPRGPPRAASGFPRTAVAR